jgi:hypothetical protein
MNFFKHILKNMTRSAGYHLSFHIADKLDIWPYVTWDVMNRIYSQPRSLEKWRLLPHGFKYYSQNDEDGIIKEIFRRVRIETGFFVEMGVGDGLENNTLHLLHQGWKGLWIDANKNNCRNINVKFSNVADKGMLKVCHAFVIKENVNYLLHTNSVLEEFDLLSIDIDGNDYHVFSAMKAFRPRVVVIEYNAKFPPPILAVAKYDPQFVWDLTDYYGASLKSLELLMSNRGYSLVGCNITGLNAFFVRDDLVRDHFCQPFTAENHYEPPRYWLTKGFVAGHLPSFGDYDFI